jgi:hypothetical protein
MERRGVGPPQQSGQYRPWFDYKEIASMTTNMTTQWVKAKLDQSGDEIVLNLSNVKYLRGGVRGNTLVHFVDGQDVAVREEPDTLLCNAKEIGGQWGGAGASGAAQG